MTYFLWTKSKKVKILLNFEIPSSTMDLQLWRRHEGDWLRQSRCDNFRILDIVFRVSITFSSFFMPIFFFLHFQLSFIWCLFCLLYTNILLYPNSNNDTTALKFIPLNLTLLYFLFVTTPSGAMTLNMTAFYMEDVFNVSVSAMKGSADAKQITIGATAPIDYTLLCLTLLW